jgi:hypothetical protein
VAHEHFGLCILTFNAGHPAEAGQVIIAALFFGVYIDHDVKLAVKKSTNNLMLLK